MKSLETKQEKIQELKEKLLLLEEKNFDSISKKIDFFSNQWYSFFQLTQKLSSEEIKKFFDTKLAHRPVFFYNYSEIFIQKQILTFLRENLKNEQKVDIAFIKHIHRFFSFSSIFYEKNFSIESLESGTYRKRNFENEKILPYRDISRNLSRTVSILNQSIDEKKILENAILFLQEFFKVMPFSKNNEKVAFCVINYYLLKNFYVPSFFLKNPSTPDFFSETIQIEFYNHIIDSFQSYIEYLNPKVECAKFSFQENLSPLEKIKAKSYSKYHKKVLESSLKDLIFPVLSKMLHSLEKLSYLFIAYDKEFCLKYDNFLEDIPEDFMESSTWILEKSSILDRVQSIRVNYNFSNLKVDKKLESNLVCTISILFDLNQFRIIFMSEGYHLSQLVSYYIQEKDEKQIALFAESCKQQFYKIIRKLANH